MAYGYLHAPTQVSRFSTRVSEQGVTGLVAEQEGSLLICGTVEGAVRAVDGRAGGAVAEWTGHTAAVLDMQLQDNTLVTASDDHTARVWDIRLAG